MFSNCHLFIYLFIYLFKVDKFTKMQYTYIHKSSQTDWLIKINYPIFKKKGLVSFDKKKKKKTKNKTGL